MDSLKDFFAPVPIAMLIGIIFLAAAVWLFFRNLSMSRDFAENEVERNQLRLRIMTEKKAADYLKALEAEAAELEEAAVGGSQEGAKQ